MNAAAAAEEAAKMPISRARIGGAAPSTKTAAVEVFLENEGWEKHTVFMKGHENEPCAKHYQQLVSHLNPLRSSSPKKDPHCRQTADSTAERCSKYRIFFSKIWLLLRPRFVVCPFLLLPPS